MIYKMSLVNGMPALAQTFSIELKAALYNTASSIKDEAQILAPEDRGVLKHSIHVAARSFSEYGASRNRAEADFAASHAAGRTPKGRAVSSNSKFEFYDEVRPNNDNEVFVVVGAPHGHILEFGSGKQPPQPFLLPAVEHNGGVLATNVSTALNGAAVQVQLSMFSRLKP